MLPIVPPPPPPPPVKELRLEVRLVKAVSELDRLDIELKALVMLERLPIAPVMLDIRLPSPAPLIRVCTVLNIEVMLVKLVIKLDIEPPTGRRFLLGALILICPARWFI